MTQRHYEQWGDAQESVEYDEETQNRHGLSEQFCMVPEYLCRTDIRHYKQGQLHSDNGPAWVHYEPAITPPPIKTLERWCVNGKYHREDGPAKIFYDRNGNITEETYYLNDKQLTKEEWEEQRRQN